MDQLNYSAWSAQQAQKQMDFQERMSNTAHQREVADLMAAGLNPVLSSGGNGASTPVGSMATGNPDDFSSALGAIQAFAYGFGKGSTDSKDDQSTSFIDIEHPDSLNSDDILEKMAAGSKSNAKELLKLFANSIYTKNPRNFLQRAGNFASGFLLNNADEISGFNEMFTKTVGPTNPGSGYYYLKNYKGETKATQMKEVPRFIKSLASAFNSAKGAIGAHVSLNFPRRSSR